MSKQISCLEMINRIEYPIDELEHQKSQQVIDLVRKELSTDGCAVIRKFFSKAGLNALLSEAHELSEQAYYSPKKNNAMFIWVTEILQ